MLMAFLQIQFHQFVNISVIINSMQISQISTEISVDQNNLQFGMSNVPACILEDHQKKIVEICKLTFPMQTKKSMIIQTFRDYPHVYITNLIIALEQEDKRVQKNRSKINFIYPKPENVQTYYVPAKVRLPQVQTIQNAPFILSNSVHQNLQYNSLNANFRSQNVNQTSILNEVQAVGVQGSYTNWSQSIIQPNQNHQVHASQNPSSYTSMGTTIYSNSAILPSSLTQLSSLNLRH